MRRAIQQQRVTIWRSACHTSRTDGATRPWLIFHHHRLAQNARQGFRNNARHHINDAASSEGHNHANGPRWVAALCECWRGKRAAGQRKKITTLQHGVFLLVKI
jgi:hypothetical protein